MYDESFKRGWPLSYVVLNHLKSSASITDAVMLHVYNYMYTPVCTMY